MSEILQTFNREKPGAEFIAIIHRLRMFGIIEQLSEIIVFPKNLEELSSDTKTVAMVTQTWCRWRSSELKPTSLRISLLRFLL